MVAAILLVLLAAIAMIGLAGQCGWFEARSAAHGVGKIMVAAGEWDYPGANMKPIHFHGQTFLGQGTAKKKVLFVGDSNMEQYWPRIETLISRNPNSSKQAVFATSSGCLPIPGVLEISHPNCEGFMEAVTSFSQDPSIETIVITAQWWGYLSGSTYYYEDSGGKFYLKPDSRGPEKAYSALEHMLTDWTESGKRVYLVLNIPVGIELAPQSMVTRSGFGGDFHLETNGLSKLDFVDGTKLVSSNLRHAANVSHATVIDPIEYLCDDTRCPAITRDGDPIYKDAAHLRPTYVRREVKFLDDAFITSP